MVAASADTARTVWSPRRSDLDRSRLLALVRRSGCDDLDALHLRAIDDPEWFWREVVDDLGIRFDVPFEQVLDTSAGREFPSWYHGGRLNLATTCVDQWANGPAAQKWRRLGGRGRTVRIADLCRVGLVGWRPCTIPAVPGHQTR